MLIISRTILVRAVLDKPTAMFLWSIRQSLREKIKDAGRLADARIVVGSLSDAAVELNLREVRRIEVGKNHLNFL